MGNELEKVDGKVEVEVEVENVVGNEDVKLDTFSSDGTIANCFARLRSDSSPPSGLLRFLSDEPEPAFGLPPVGLAKGFEAAPKVAAPPGSP